MKVYILAIIYEEIILDAHNLFGDLSPKLKERANEIKKKRRDKWLAELEAMTKKFIRNSTFIDERYGEIWRGVRSGKLFWAN